MTPQADWTTYSAELPSTLPDEAYDALRDRFFNEQVAPEVLRAGYGIETARKQFLEKTQRPGKSAYPRTELVSKTALASMAAPFTAAEPKLQQGMEEQMGEAAIEAARQGIEPEPYMMAGGMLGQLPYWAVGMGAASGVAKIAAAGPMVEAAIKVAAGGVIQGSYDLLKTGNTIEGLKGAGIGAGMVAGFEALGGLKSWLTSKGATPEVAAAVEQVAKGSASPEQWQLATEATLANGNLDKSIQEWVGGQVKAARQSGVAKSLVPDYSAKGLTIQMTGADGQSYTLKSPGNIESAIGRISEHLEAGGSLDQITGPPKAVSQFYQLLSSANEHNLDLFGSINGKASAATVPLQRATQQDLKAATDLNSLINARNSYYHATDLEGMRGILRAGEISAGDVDPENFADQFNAAEELGDQALNDLVASKTGVSVSRTPRLASKADKAITFVIDAEKMPKTRPYVEEGFGKTVKPDWENDPEGLLSSSPLSQDEIDFMHHAQVNEPELVEPYLAQLKEKYSEARRNETFEFEQRTYNEPVPLSAVRGILVDQKALQTEGGWMSFETHAPKDLQDQWSALDAAGKTEEAGNLVRTWNQDPNKFYDSRIAEKIAEIQQLASKHSIHIKIFSSGRELHSYRAGLAKQPEGMKWALEIPLSDQLEALPTGQVRNKLTGKMFESAQDIGNIKYKETPLSHRYSGNIPEEILPEGAQAASVDLGEGQKPEMFYREANKELVFHENLHGHFGYLGIDKWLNAEHNSPIVQDIFHNAFPPEAKALYATKGIPEEVFNYAASAVRTNNQTLLDHFAEADTDLESVLKWTSDTAQSILDKAAESSDSLHKRTLERRLSSVVTRSSEKLADINKPYATSPLELDLEGNQYAVREGSSVHYFSDRQAALEHMESAYIEPLQSPELIPMHNLPEGVPKYALKVPAPSNKLPLSSDPLPEDLLPKPLKAGTSVFSFFFRPFYDWLSDVAQKFEKPDLFSAFSGVDESIKTYNNILRPYLRNLADTLGKHSQERQTDFFKWMQAADEHKPFVEKELRFTAEELSHLQQYREQFAQLGGDFEDYLQKDLPKLRHSTVEDVFPAGKDKSLIGGLVRRGSLDPKDTNLLRASSIYLRKQLHSSLVEPAIGTAEKLVDEAIEGRPALGQLQPLLRRKIETYRGQPDFTERAVNGLVEATVDSINQGLESANKHLPDNLQISLIESPPRDILQKALMYQYAGSLGARPGLIMQTALQAFITSFPLAGNYIWKGMGRAFEVAREKGASDAWQIAQKYGAFVDKANISELVAGGGEATQSIAEKALRVLQWSDNSGRLVAFWAHSEKALDALHEFRLSGNTEKLIKDSDLWFMPESMRAKYLKELPNLSLENTEDLSRRIGATLVDLTQWNYRKGAQPGMYQWQLGRLFGQYGTWPLNYVEYGRRFLQGSDKSAVVQALARLTLAHGSILAAGGSVGVDTSGWVFLQPMAYSGGPILQATVDAPTAATDWSTPRGQEARRNVTNLINPLHYFPGYNEAHSIWKATAAKDDDIWKLVMGFKPLKGD